MGDRKCEDPNRTPRNKRFLRIVRMVWGLVLLSIAVGVYHNVLRRDKAPQFAFYLNGLLLTNDACVTIPTTNDSIQLNYSVRNVGDCEASDVIFRTIIPEHLKVIPSGGWNRGEGYAVHATNEAAYAPVYGFSVPSTYRAFPPGERESFAHLTLKCDNLRNSVNYLDLRINAKDNFACRTGYAIRVINGTGTPYIGF
jgi:uncharacterized repeat protein (TIGR01451 family)